MSTINISEPLDPFHARVLRKSDGSARLDLQAFPRIEHLLIGRPMSEATHLVTRLCGLCPVTHFLAAERAIDQLSGRAISAAEQVQRRVLHYGSVLDALAPRARAAQLRALGRNALAAAGMPGHFPTPEMRPDLLTVQAALATLPAARKEAAQAIENLESSPAPSLDASFPDALDVFLPDPLGEEVRVGPLTMTPTEFGHAVAESNPGSSLPRPTVNAKPYRVGPAAHHPEMSPALAQATSLLKAVDKLAELLPQLADTTPEDYALRPGEGIGLVDGPRGLLMHRYRLDEDLVVKDSQILTPTAQNEPWLAAMLTAQLARGEDLELAIRAADPCLPCTMGPVGSMNIEIVED